MNAAQAGEVHPAQAALAETAEEIAAEFGPLAERHEYGAALELIAGLRGPVDAFFEQVMVMDPDESVRADAAGIVAAAGGDFLEGGGFFGDCGGGVGGHAPGVKAPDVWRGERPKAEALGYLDP